MRGVNRGAIGTVSIKLRAKNRGDTLKIRLNPPENLFYSLNWHYYADFFIHSVLFVSHFTPNSGVLLITSEVKVVMFRWCR